MEEVTSLGIFLSRGQMCVDFREGTEISAAELDTAAPETQREVGPCVLHHSLATILDGADPECRPGFVMGLEAILFQVMPGRNSVIKSQGLLAWVTITPRHHLRTKSHTKYKRIDIYDSSVG